MSTDRLIATLAADVTVVPRHAIARRLLLGGAIGAAVTLALVILRLGLRADLGAAMGGGAFWMKLAYTVALGIGAGAMLARLARPERVRLRRFWPVAIPVVPLAAAAAVELARAPAGLRPAMWLGRTALVCPWLVLALSLPIFAGLAWSFRRLAPTRLRTAGAAAGYASGAWAATLYGLHCPEGTASFVLTWYSLGIALAAAVGALLGPRLLRW